jgi:hypothetical protein
LKFAGLRSIIANNAIAFRLASVEAMPESSETTILYDPDEGEPEESFAWVNRC